MERKKAVSDDLTKSVQDIILPCISAETKYVPHWYLWDSYGSELFEKIATENPYYNVRKAETSIINNFAGEITESLYGPEIIISELGAGSSEKNFPFIEVLLQKHKNVEYIPIDIAKEFMEGNAKLLQEKYKDLVVTPFAGDYDDGIRNLKTRSKPVLLLFMGSSFSNLPVKNMLTFLIYVKNNMKEEDRFVIGIDLTQNVEKLKLAYTHPGTEVPFTKNTLTRLNRDFGADFDLDDFELHFNYVISEDTEVFTHPQYIQMNLQSLADQTIHLKAIGKELNFKKGEKLYIHELENLSVKWNWTQFTELIEKAGFYLENKWTDQDNSYGLACIRTNFKYTI